MSQLEALDTAERERNDAAKAAERALADAKAAVEAAEIERRRNDKVIALCDSPNGTLALTATGRVFRHVADPRHANDGITRVKMIWSEIPGPLA